MLLFASYSNNEKKHKFIISAIKKNESVTGLQDLKKDLILKGFENDFIFNKNYIKLKDIKKGKSILKNLDFEKYNKLGILYIFNK